MEELYAKLDELLDVFNEDLIYRNEFLPHKYDIDEKLSEENLNKIIKNNKDLEIASDIDHNDNRFLLDPNFLLALQMVKEDSCLDFFGTPMEVFVGGIQIIIMLARGLI